MIAFPIVAALMLALALSFVLPTLLRKQLGTTEHVQRDALNLDVLRDQLRELDADRSSGVIDEAGYASSRQELERRVAEDVRPAARAAATIAGKPWFVIALGVLIPVLAVGMYLLLGNRAGLDPARAVVADSGQTVTPEQINGMVEGLAKKLKDNPDNVEGWSMLARSYIALGRFGEAADAYAQLLKRVPPNADLLADYADALGMAMNKSLQGEPENLIERALALDPKNIKALALSGGAKFERHDYAAAITQWKKILALAPPDSEMARTVTGSIEEAQSLIGAPNAPAASGSVEMAAAAAPAPAASTEPAAVSGTVELDASLRSQVVDSDTVFIFARAVNGPRFPLAVLQKHVRDLPVSFVLDDSMSMMPNAKLSGFQMVVVGARISKSGSATPGVGDLEGLTEPVRPGAKELKIKIDSRHK